VTRIEARIHASQSTIGSHRQRFMLLTRQRFFNWVYTVTQQHEQFNNEQTMNISLQRAAVTSKGLWRYLLSGVFCQVHFKDVYKPCTWKHARKSSRQINQESFFHFFQQTGLSGDGKRNSLFGWQNGELSLHSQGRFIYSIHTYIYLKKIHFSSDSVK